MALGVGFGRSVSDLDCLLVHSVALRTKVRPAYAPSPLKVSLFWKPLKFTEHLVSFAARWTQILPCGWV